MGKEINSILVDLTPVLPGGENGGAKLFVLELLKKLAKANPSTHFTLLTQSKAHAELASLDSENISRLMVENATGRKSFIARLVNFTLRHLPFIPSRLSLIGYRVFCWLKKRAIKNIIATCKPDLVFCPFTAPTYTIKGVPSVCVIYDLQYKTHPLFFARADMLNRDHAFTEACRVATRLTAISDYSRASAITHGQISPDKIRTIYLRMAKRAQPHTKTLTSLFASLEIEEKRYLLYPANFWLHKNHEMLLTALKMAYNSKYLGQDVKLVCTGAPGQRQQWLMDAALRMDLKSQVVFTGFLKDSDLATLLHNAVGVIFPSLYEGFGLPILEAMAAQVPVACSNITSLPEIAGDGAILFDPRKPNEIANAMRDLVNNTVQRQALIEVGKQRVQTFCDSGRMAEEYWHLFQEAQQTQFGTVPLG